ncbi:MAG: HlyD family secretion protein [Gammaproteobacteria bacterium]|nr:HlyD family secretion protein [Gammaproteobacteria bacterium]
MSGSAGPTYRRTRRWVRLVLLVVVPLAAVWVGLALYARGGRIVETETAYIKADIVAVSADVSGRVVHVAVKDNQSVSEGDLLFRIDPVPFQIQVSEAEAEMAIVKSEIDQLRFDYREAEALAREARDRLTFLERQLQRQEKLRAQRMGSEEAFDAARHEFNMGTRQLQVLEQRIARTLAKLDGNPALPPDLHPRYQRAKAMRDKAEVDLNRTTVRAPAEGVVSNMKLQVGEYVEEGEAVFSLIETESVWVEANLKETQLAHVREEQEATVIVDAYPDRRIVAHVDTIAPATGAEFALLPPQNATGNWVKVVQRVPVRLRIQREDDTPALRAGMTATVRIDTQHQRELPAFANVLVGRASIVDLMPGARANGQQ